MKIVQHAIRFPVTTAVGVILLVLFGTLALNRIPVQLTPNVEDPEITISTFWPGASPQEVEREIVDEQEDQLKTLEGLVKMESSSSDSFGSITLTFQVGTDIDSALLKVSNALEQVPSYPADADKPVIRTVDPNANAMAWFILEPLPGTDYDGHMPHLFDFCDEVLKPEIERVPGVGTAGIFGGEQREMQVVADPAKLAARRVTLNELGAALESENRNYSGGDFAEGKRRYIVRTTGEYRSAEDIENIVIAVRNDVPIFLRDVAHAKLGYRKPQARVYEKGRLLIAMNAVREPGTNAIEVMAGVREAVSQLNREVLADRNLRLRQVYDQTEYIESAISLVKQSLLVGGFLALLVLIIYLRSGTSTLVIAIAIPISVIGAFLMMFAFGRSLNVISLAGMAFAVGMVVDNSIVVLENIYRHRQMGKPRRQAAHDGAREVWGAVLASTLTTIAVFVPVVFIQEEAGQLFGDIAIAISCAVALSLIVSITVIPSLSAKILRAAGRGDGGRARNYRNLWGGVTSAQRFTDRVAEAVDWINASTLRRLVVIISFTGIAIGLSMLLMPQGEYLPLGNQNFLIGFMLPPPGLSLDEMSELQDIYKETLEPLWEHEAGSAEAQALPGGGIQNYFFVTFNNSAFIVASANEALRVRELIPSFFAGNAKTPGAFVVVSQSSIFERGLGEGRNIDVELTGPELERLIELGGEVLGNVMQKLPGVQARPIPSLDLGNPEVQVRTDRRRAADLGISNRDLAFAVSALVDGVKASDFRLEGKEIDLKLLAAGDGPHHTHLLEQLPIATPDGRLVTLGSVADIAVLSGPTTINHSERERTITIQVTPDERMPLEQAMQRIETEILDPMRDGGRLGGLYQAGLSGSADKLTQTGKALQLNLLLALAITYLLLAALFESFLYPFVIMFSVPLAALGGFLGLAAVNALIGYQAMDVLTMLGFIILIGTVVNNAILIVHQSLNHMRTEGMTPRDAIRESVRTRIRPIFMSVSTSVFGMLPLVLFPGAGSELYRGLGGVVVGGLVVSTVFTLFLVPALFSLSLDIRAAVVTRLRRLPLAPREADAR
jgi:HAE1 family hydrophobic/amphiphilic exporter-1